MAPGDWSPAYWLTMLVMWWVMMIAMMVPSAAPVILLHARVARHGQERGQIPGAVASTAAFAAGYLVCWLGFSAIATLLQFGLERFGLARRHDDVVDGTLVDGGPADRRRPLSALAAQDGLPRPVPVTGRVPGTTLAPGAARRVPIGCRHGAYCLGCCWALMLLLFAAGIMNLLWIAGLSILVLLEKLAPFGAALTKPIAVLLLFAGAALLVVPG